MAPLVWLLAFILVQAALLIAAGRAHKKARPGSQPSWRARLVQGILGLLVLMVAVTILIPTGHGPNYEARVIGEMRNFASVQAAFQSASGGVFATPECLVEAGKCIPEYKGPQFSPSPDPGNSERMQYKFTFHAGPPATSPTAARGLESWVYVATPATRRTRGMRSFCVDSRGYMAFATGGEPIVVSSMECPPSLSPLR
jgi:hypothetical protein